MKKKDHDIYKLEKTKLNQSTKVIQSDTKYVNFMLLNLKPRAKTANDQEHN